MRSGDHLPGLMTTLAFTALLSLLSGLLIPAFIALPPAAPLHLIFALGIMPLILGAMTYFIPVLTRTGAPETGTLIPPAAALLAGIVVVFSLLLLFRLYPLAAGLALLATGGLAWWARQRARMTLGRPHPGLLWYQLALGALALGLMAIMLAALWPAQWLPLKRLHLHLNTLGFVGFTALGTLRVLLPTVGGFPDPQAGPWLLREWRWFTVGTLLIAFGAAWQPLVAGFGLLLWLIGLARLIHVPLLTRRSEIWSWHGAATPLAAAIAGLLLCLLAGAAHGLGWLPASRANEAFVMAFLLPLVTGAATHLLPLWLWHRQPPEKQQLLRDSLGYLGGLRALIFLVAGMLVLAGQSWASLLCAVALGQFLFQFVSVLLSSR